MYTANPNHCSLRMRTKNKVTVEAIKQELRYVETKSIMLSPVSPMSPVSPISPCSSMLPLNPTSRDMPLSPVTVQTLSSPTPDMGFATQQNSNSVVKHIPGHPVIHSPLLKSPRRSKQVPREIDWNKDQLLVDAHQSPPRRAEDVHGIRLNNSFTDAFSIFSPRVMKFFASIEEEMMITLDIHRMTAHRSMLMQGTLKKFEPRPVQQIHSSKRSVQGMQSTKATTGKFRHDIMRIELARPIPYRVQSHSKQSQCRHKPGCLPLRHRPDLFKPKIDDILLAHSSCHGVARLKSPSSSTPNQPVYLPSLLSTARLRAKTVQLPTSISVIRPPTGLDRSINHLKTVLVPLISVTTGLAHPDFPLSLLQYHLLTHDQLDNLARWYHQTIDPCQATSLYPSVIMKPWTASLRSTSVVPSSRMATSMTSILSIQTSLDDKRRRFGRFIGLRGCESPILTSEQTELMREQETLRQRMEREWKQAIERAEDERKMDEKMGRGRF